MAARSPSLVALALVAAILPPRTAHAKPDAEPTAPGEAPADAAQVEPNAAAVPPGPSPTLTPGRLELDALKGLLAEERRAQSRYRLWSLVVGAAALAPAIPVALHLFDREEPISGGVVLGTGIGAALGAALVQLLPVRPLTVFADRVDALEHEGKAPAEVLRTIDAEWGEEVDDLATQRQIAGGVAIALGVGALAAGSVVGLTYERPSSSLAQIEVEPVAAATLVAAGTLASIAGVQTLLFASPEETTYRLFHALTQLGVAPRPGGAVVGVGGRF